MYYVDCTHQKYMEAQHYLKRWFKKLILKGNLRNMKNHVEVVSFSEGSETRTVENSGLLGMYHKGQTPNLAKRREMPFH